MQNWFECKTKYVRVDDDGRERKVNEMYLVDAVSVTDAETRLIEQLKTMVRGEFVVGKVAESNIIEIFPYEDGQWWYKAKIQTVVIDESLGKEKKANHYFLVAADDIKQALQRLEEGLSYLLVPYSTISIVLSAVVDVFPYFDENTAIPNNLKPIVKECVVYDSEEETE
ncbi:MAG: DUF4494 domain-containing protein [Bacteroidales bacterium]|nr:DUF4494 domain-containing protein [Bacteroidales bacterium]